MKKNGTIFSIASLFVLLLCSNTLIAQTAPPTPGNRAPEFHQFDFWVGEWELTWHDTANGTVTGTNHITKLLNDNVVHESFSDPTNNYYGQSWSVYHPQRKLWQQTWVDNQGGYLDFTGGMTDGKMILSRSFVNPAGKTVHQRMVFFDIAKNSLSWSWESSLDEGTTWKQQWLIHYKRKK